MYRSDPVGGVANGIPRKIDTLASMTPFGDLQNKGTQVFLRTRSNYLLAFNYILIIRIIL